MEGNRVAVLLPATGVATKNDFDDAFNELVQKYVETFGHTPIWHSPITERDLQPTIKDGPYLIWNIGRGHPTVEHDSITSAKGEAARLAGKQPGDYFLVMAPIAKCYGELDVKVHWEDD